MTPESKFRRGSAIAALAAVILTMLSAGANAVERPPATTPAKAPITLYVFGPELPFMFETTGRPLDFAWSDLIASGDTGVGTIAKGAGEVVGIGGEFYVADESNPTPKKISDELTPSGVVATLNPNESFSISSRLDLNGLQKALDEKFVDTDSFVYMFMARGTLSSVEYQLAGPSPSNQVRKGIESGDSQQAVTIGTRKYTAKNVPATLVGIRAPAYLNTVFEIPYHIHFIADDRSLLGHVTGLQAEGLEISWARSDAIAIRYWDTK